MKKILKSTVSKSPYLNKNITDFKLIYNSKNRGGVRIYQYLKNIELDHE